MIWVILILGGLIICQLVFAALCAAGRADRQMENIDNNLRGLGSRAGLASPERTALLTRGQAPILPALLASGAVRRI